MAKHLKKTERQVNSSEVKFTNVYVKNIDLEVTEEQLRDKFAELGHITNLIIMRDENGVSKGFGFVNFEDPDNAKKAVETLNETEFGMLYFLTGSSECIYISALPL